MLYLIDWLAEDKAGGLHRQILLDLDWRSEAEFQSYLARVLEELVDEEWPRSLEYIRKFRQTGVRHNARSLGMGLLEACVLNCQGKYQEAQKVIEDYGDRIRNPWFLDIHDYLLGKQTEKSLKEKAGETPEKLVTAYTFMGFWAEGSGKPDKALKHYREALVSFLDDWPEYDFAQERIKKLRATAGAKAKGDDSVPNDKK